MIRTTQPQTIEPVENGESAIVYFEAHSRTDLDKAPTPEIKYHVDLRFMRDGVLTYWKRNPARYKRATWKSKFGAFSNNHMEENFDKILIDEILAANTRVWTGNELQKIEYWKENLTQKSDFVIIQPDGTELFWDGSVWVPA